MRGSYQASGNTFCHVLHVLQKNNYLLQKRVKFCVITATNQDN